MKVNVELDVTPEEVRAVFGLPDLQPLHQTVISRVNERLQSSAEQSEAMFQTMLSGAMEPWQMFSKFLNAASSTNGGKADDSPSKT